MPNWCHNSLCVSGPKSDLEIFMERVQGEEVYEGEKVINLLNFNTLVPLPEEENENWKDQEGVSHDWQVEHWGTKWQADEVSVEWELNLDNEDYLFYQFLTAWSAPDKFIKAVALMFPTITFELRSCDPSMDWDYQLTAHGDEVSESENPYNEEAEDYWGLQEEAEAGNWDVREGSNG